MTLGISADTAQFAVECLRMWIKAHIREYPGAKSILLLADGGGSNGHRVRLFKIELQKLADETGLILKVSHFPPGASKWNKIEHRLFSAITSNWRGRPLVSIETARLLIAHTTTKKGLKVVCTVDKNTYKTKIKVSKKEMAAINIVRDVFHGEWNYAIHPISPEKQPSRHG